MSSKKNYVFYYKGPGKSLNATILEISDWEGFEKLIQFVEIYYHADVVKRIDGPDARRWILNCKGQSIELIHDDGYGNYFLAPTEESEPLIYEIAHDIEQRFRKLEGEE